MRATARAWPVRGLLWWGHGRFRRCRQLGGIQKSSDGPRNAAKEAEKAQKCDEGGEKWKQLLALLHVYKKQFGTLMVPQMFAVPSEAPRPAEAWRIRTFFWDIIR